MMMLMVAMIFAAVFLGVLAYYQARYPAPVRENPDDGDSGLEQSPSQRERIGFWERWEQAALQAGLGWNRQVYYGIAGGSLALAALLAVLTEFALMLMVLVAGLFGPYLYVRQRQAKRADQFAQQLPGALFMAASVLRAGGTLMQAVDAIAAEAPSPMREEFARIQQQMRLQVPAHEAMASAAKRVGVREFAAVIVAARITTEVGGNLAHLFDQIARAITDAQNARRTLRSFTTEGRISANMIAALPFVVMGLLHLVSPGYFGTLFATWPGRIILVGCVLTILAGWLLIRRMVDIRIH